MLWLSKILRMPYNLRRREYNTISAGDLVVRWGRPKLAPKLPTRMRVELRTSFMHARLVDANFISDVDRSKDQTEERATESGTCGLLSRSEGRAFKSIHVASNCSTQTQIDLLCKPSPLVQKSKFTAWICIFFFIRGCVQIFVINYVAQKFKLRPPLDWKFF
jgi:hypothetical protein